MTTITHDGFLLGEIASHGERLNRTLDDSAAYGPDEELEKEIGALRARIATLKNDYKKLYGPLPKQKAIARGQKSFRKLTGINVRGWV